MRHIGLLLGLWFTLGTASAQSLKGITFAPPTGWTTVQADDKSVSYSSTDGSMLLLGHVEPASGTFPDWVAKTKIGLFAKVVVRKVLADKAYREGERDEHDLVVQGESSKTSPIYSVALVEEHGVRLVVLWATSNFEQIKAHAAEVDAFVRSIDTRGYELKRTEPKPGDVAARAAAAALQEAPEPAQGGLNGIYAVFETETRTNFATFTSYEQSTWRVRQFRRDGTFTYGLGSSVSGHYLFGGDLLKMTDRDGTRTRRVSHKGDGLQFDGDPVERLVTYPYSNLPPKLKLSDISPGVSVSTAWTFGADGRFGLASAASASASSDRGHRGDHRTIGTASRDERNSGTWELAQGVLTLRFDNGSVERHALRVLASDVAKARINWIFVDELAYPLD